MRISDWSSDVCSSDLQILDAMITSCENAKTVLRQAAIDPSDRKTLNISMGASVAAEYLGRTPEALSKAEARKRLPAPKTSANGRRSYTFEDRQSTRLHSSHSCQSRLQPSD